MCDKAYRDLASLIKSARRAEPTFARVADEYCIHLYWEHGVLFYTVNGVETDASAVLALLDHVHHAHGDHSH